MVLKKSYDGTQWLETYYVYDDFDLLRFVIPPKAVDAFKEAADYGNIELISENKEVRGYQGKSYTMIGNITLSLAQGFSYDASLGGHNFFVKFYDEDDVCPDPVNELYIQVRCT